MRDLPAALSARLSLPVSQPCVLAQLELEHQVLRLCSRESVTWGGYTWEAGRCQLADMKDQPGAAQSADLLIDNADYAFTDLFTLADPRGSAVSVWVADGSGTLQIDQAVLVLEGEMDAVPQIDAVIRCSLSSAGRLREFSPRHRLLPPLCNHLTAPGTIVDWGGERIVLGGK
ncbi:MAG: hypothetical protein ACWA5X_05690 [bacterium]